MIKGGGIMSTTNDITATLRAQEHGHQPIVCFESGGCPTLVAGQETHVVYCLQGNGIDRDDNAGCNGKGYTGGYRTP